MSVVISTGYAHQHYLVPVPSQDRLGWLQPTGIQWEMMEVGAPIVRIGWRPDGLSVHLPLLSFPAP